MSSATACGCFQNDGSFLCFRSDLEESLDEVLDLYLKITCSGFLCVIADSSCTLADFHTEEGLYTQNVCVNTQF